jgi:hypothetical protein
MNLKQKIVLIIGVFALLVVVFDPSEYIPVGAGVSGTAFSSEIIPMEIQLKSGFLNGNDFRDYTNTEQINYVMGVIDGFYLGVAFKGKVNFSQWIDKCVEGMRSDQVKAMIEKFMNENPQVWHGPMNGIILDTFQEYCPNSPKRQIKK